MLVLLPPSEGKTAARRGKPLDLSALSFPELTPAREAMVERLVDLAVREPDGLRAALGLSERQGEEIARDAALLTAPTSAAGAVYTGVLYDALDLATLSTPARRRAGRWLVVMSALFGAVRVGDRIPAYRLSGDTVLPDIGAVGRTWREPLASVLPAAAGRGLVVDLRSSAYATMWTPDAALAARTVAVRVLAESRRDGRWVRTVVSHHNKSTKGRLVRALLEAGDDPRHVEELLEACAAVGFTAEAGEPPRPGRPHQVDVVVREL